MCTRSALLGCLMLALSAGSATAAPTITEFPVSTQNNLDPLGIASLSPGTLVVAEGAGSGDVGFASAATGTTSQYSTLSGSASGVTVAGGYVWLTEPNANKIARVTPVLDAQGGYPLQEFPVPGMKPQGIAADALGNVWFTESANPGAIGKLNISTGAITQYPIAPNPGSDPTSIVAGPDGNMWFTESGPNATIGRITPTGTITQFTTGLTPGSDPTSIAAGPDGNLWFTESGGSGAIGRITPSGAVTQFTTGLTADSQPTSIAPGPAGDLWFTESANPGAIGWITPQGAISQMATPTANSAPNGITLGPDGNEWFTEDGGRGQIGRVTVPAPTTTTSAATATGTTAATLNGAANPNGFATTYHFQWGATPAYGNTLPAVDAAVGSGSASEAVTQALTGLTPDTTYHYRLVATNCGGCQAGTTDGSDMTFTTAGPPAAAPPPTPPATTPAPPVLGRSALITTVSGTVLVRPPHSSGLEPLTATRNIPVGSLVDARRGRIKLTTEITRAGRVQSATAWGGEFVLQQTRARGMTTFRIADEPLCPAAGRHAGLRSDAIADASRKQPVSLWAHDHDGRYSTRGNNSVATVRGTWWKTTESCRGTRTYVKRGIVSVLDLHTRHRVLVHAGHSFLARP